MKTLFNLTIAINGLIIKEAFDKPEPICNLDNFQFDLKHEVELAPEEYANLTNNFGKLLTTMAYEFLKPSSAVSRPADTVCPMKDCLNSTCSACKSTLYDDVPDGHDCTHETYHLDCGFCRARARLGICSKCHHGKAIGGGALCNNCFEGR